MPKRLIIFLCSLLVLAACSTERYKFQPGEIPEISTLSSEDEQYGHEVLGMIMDEYQLDRDDNNINRVRGIVDKLAASANSGNAPWHVYVFKDDSVENAAATRGNYIFIWTGMLKRVADDNELATVLAHELSHVLAGHTMPTPTEEFSEMFGQVTGQITSEIVSAQGPYGPLASIAGALTQAIIEAAIVNPEQQRKELEADQIGLFLMSKAGYDPDRAIEFWSRMSNDGSGDFGLIQFISTHPSSSERLTRLNELLPEARKYRPGYSDTSLNSSNDNWAYQDRPAREGSATSSQWTIQ